MRSPWRSLSAKQKSMTSDKVTKFEYILTGGDLRSISKANEIVEMVHTQEDFDELFPGLQNTDRKIVMRTADAIEKITISKSGYLQKHKTEVLNLFQSAKEKELKWHMALIVSRVKLSKKELGKTWDTLTKWATDKKESKIVRVNSIQSLSDLLQQDNELAQDFELTLFEIAKENIPSINARIRKLKKANR